MSDNLPALRHPAAVVAATADTDSWTQVVDAVAQLASKITDTEFVPRGLRGNTAATAAAMLYGREVGLPPMTALTSTHVVNGRPGISAEMMRALVYAAGHELEFVEATGAVCRMRARRAGSQTWTELAWTLDMARAAGLLGKDVWKAYPRDMLTARCTAALCRMVFPDVIHGFRAVEELQDMGSEPGDTAPVAPSGGPRRRVTRGKAPAEPPAELQQPALPAPAEASAPAEHDTPPVPLAVPLLPGEDGPRDTPQQAVEAPAPTEGADHPPPVPVKGESTAPGSVSKAQLKMLMATWARFAVRENRDTRLQVTSTIVGRPIESSNDLSRREASLLINTLAQVNGDDALEALTTALDTEDVQ